MQSLVQIRRELRKEHIAGMHATYTENCLGCEYRKDYEVYVETLGTFGIKVRYIPITEDWS
jgi:N-dimethylarginine dimethylaminohydrolase